MASTRTFIGFFIGVCVMFAGVGMWFAIADQDYQYIYEESTEEQPRYSGTLGYYSSLSEAEQSMVDRALAGEAPRAESRGTVPPEVVKKDGTYYVFRKYSYYDWLDPRTGGSLVVSLLGFLGVVAAARKDVAHRGVV
jgi:hypothetical protein